MKKIFTIFFLVLSVIFCSCSIIPTATPANYDVEATAKPASTTVDIGEAGTLKITDLTSRLQGGNSVSLDQMCYLEDSKELYVLTNLNNTSKIIALDMVGNGMTDMLLKNKVIRADVFDGTVFAFEAQQIVQRDIRAGTEINYEIPNKEIRLIASCISSDKRNLVHFDDNNIYLTALSNPEKTQQIPIDVNGRLLLVLPLKNDLYFATAVVDDKKSETVVVNHLGEAVFRGDYDSAFPAPFLNGILLHQGQESNVSNKLFIVDIVNKTVSEILTIDPMETNAANISNNGRWVITATFDASTNKLVARLYDTIQKKYSEYEVPANYFTGTANILGSSDSLFISDDGLIGGLRLLDDAGFKLLKFEFPAANKALHDFTSTLLDASSF